DEGQGEGSGREGEGFGREGEWVPEVVENLGLAAKAAPRVDGRWQLRGSNGHRWRSSTDQIRVRISSGAARKRKMLSRGKGFDGAEIEPGNGWRRTTFVEEKWRRRRREGGFCTSAVPSEIIRWLSSTSLHSLLLVSSTKKASRLGHLPLALGPSPNFLFSVLFYFALVGILKSWHHLDPLLPCPHLGRRPGTIRFDGGDVGGRQTRGGVAWGSSGSSRTGRDTFHVSNSASSTLEGVAAACAGRLKNYLLVVVSGGLNE
ncbi:hypothetical protein BHE74_00053429, partial [Ensete ventricosum]